MGDLLSEFRELLDRLEGQIGRMARLNDAQESTITQGLNLMADLHADIAEFTADVAAQTTVTAGLQNAIAGILATLATAQAAAAAAGASDVELQAFTDALTALKANTATITNAVVQGTGTPPAAAGPAATPASAAAAVAAAAS